MKSIISLEKYDAMITSCLFHDLTCELSVCNGSAPRPTNILRLILFSLLWESLSDSEHCKPTHLFAAHMRGERPCLLATSTPALAAR